MADASGASAAAGGPGAGVDRAKTPTEAGVREVTEGSARLAAPRPADGGPSQERVASLLEFMDIVGRLKREKRTGWVRSGVEDAESVADHMYRMAVLSLALGPAEGVDSGRCVKMALVHDIGESLIGDIVTDGNRPDKISKEDKIKKERDAVARICETVGGSVGREIRDLWEEFEACETPEARHLKDLDRFEMVLQAKEYEEAQGKPLDDFFRTTEGKSQTPLFQALDAEVRRRRSDRGSVSAAGEPEAKRPKQ